MSNFMNAIVKEIKLTMVGYDGKGKIIRSRELTEEEIAELSE